MILPLNPHFQADWPPAYQTPRAQLVWVMQRIFTLPLLPFVYLRRHLRDLVCRVIMPGSLDSTLHHTPLTLWVAIKRCAYIIWNPNAYQLNSYGRGEDLLTKWGGERVCMTTPDGVNIEGAFFGSRWSNRVVLVAGGNGTQWETQERWLRILKPLGVSVMLFNPRGLGRSRGKRSSKGWDLDCYTAIEYLIQKRGFSLDKCLPIGFSLGGATVTCGAALIQDKYPKVPLSVLNICSFSTLRAEIDALFVKPIAMCARFVLSLLGISRNAQSAFNRLQGDKVVMYRHGDRIIPKAASMAQVVSTNRDQRTTIIKLNGQRHNSPFSRREAHTIQHNVCRLLKLRPPLFSLLVRLPQTTGPI